ncbi:MAG: hypothetical protein AAF216_09520 [Pseudomonadota bacterium]
MTKFARWALLPIALLQAGAPALHILIPGLEPIGGSAESGLLRAPESPPGIFFAIWLPIFLGFIAFAGYALFKDTPLSRRLAVPLVLTGLIASSWQVISQVMDGSVLAYPFLLALAFAAWWSAYRFDEMRGLGWGWPTVAADLTTGLYAGWMTVAAAISTTSTIRTLTGLGATDHVWPMLISSLVIAASGALLAFARITRSHWYVVALAWGLTGIIINTWSITGMNVGAVLTGCVALWVLRRRFTLGATGAMAA